MTLKINDVCSWFQQQQGAARVETIVNLLQMLFPLELHFVGAYLEDLARRDYHCLRDVEHRFNIADIVARLTDINDGKCRASLIVALSLLRSTNQKTAAIVYRILLSFHVVYRQLPKTKDVYEEILLLLTMAKHHPAFKFEQKTSLAGLLDEIVNFRRRQNVLLTPSSTNGRESADIELATCDQLLTSHRRNSNCTYVDAWTQTSGDDECELVDECAKTTADAGVPEVERCPTASSVLSSPELKASDIYVTDVKVKGSQRKENTFEFTLETTWSDGEVTEIVKTQEDLYEFHRKLLDLFPSDAGCYGYNRRIPYFPGYRHSPDLDVSLSSDIIPRVYSYIQDFLAVNEDILASRYAANFLKGTTKKSSASTLLNDVVRPSSSISPDDVTGSTYCLNMLFDPSSSPRHVATSSYKQQNSNDTGSTNEDDEGLVDEGGRLKKSLIYYNSHISPNTKSDHPSSPRKNSFRTLPPAESSTSCSLVFKNVSDSSQMTLFDGDVSSTSRVVPLPTNSSPRTKDFSTTDVGKQQPPMIFVPKELYFILRKENLLKLKKFFVNYKIEELLNLNVETDVDAKLGVPLEERNEVLRVLGILKQEMSGGGVNNSPKNGILEKQSRFLTLSSLQNRLDDLEYAAARERSSHARAPSTSSVDTIESVPTKLMNGEYIGGNEYDHADVAMPVGRSQSTSGLYHKHHHSSGRPKSFHRHHSKNQLRKYSIPLNIERYGYVDDSSMLSDSSCVSETPLLLHNEDDFPPVAHGFFGVSPLPSEVTKGRGRPITKTSNSLPPSKSQSPVPNDLSPSIGVHPTSGSFSHQPSSSTVRKSTTPTATTPGAILLPTLNYPVKQSQQQPQPLRCLYSTGIIDSSTTPTRMPSMPPPPFENRLPLFAVPPPGAAYGFIRGPPPPIGPHHVVLSCQCNGAGTCQLCLASRWNVMNGGGAVLLHLGNAAAHYNPTQMAPPPACNSTTTTPFVPATNFPLAPPPPVNYPMDFTSTPNQSDQIFNNLLPPNVVGASVMPTITTDIYVDEKLLPLPPGCLLICCSNCGAHGHTAEYCNEATLDEITSAGQYHLNLRANEDTSTNSAEQVALR